MDESLRCQRCGVALTGQAVGKSCANCLLKLALDPPAEATLALDELPPGASVSIRVRYFGDYELVEEIARGGMGVVYKARQVSLNRIVALKMILAGDFSSPATVERFQTEAEAAARLEHPNIVPIYEIGAHEGQHYFSMRFVEGGTLTQAMAREKFTPRRAAELMARVARAVHHAHQRGILHRDLKPGNILLDAAGEPHVADFGLAKLLEHDSALTQSAAVMGTPSYMAPEQAEGQTKEATTAVDIYSLGAILYELLTGRPPFVGRNPLEVLAQVREREAVSPQSIRPELDRDVAVICLKCLEKDPARRYGSAEALAEDLQRWLADEPIVARSTGTLERTIKWARRKPVVASLLIAILLVGAAGFVGILWQGNRAKAQAVRATSEAQRANLEARNARQESKRAESELWNANLSEARRLRIAGGPGARAQSSALLQKLILRPGLTETQILSLRQEAIAQMALMDIVTPTNWISKLAWYPLAWSSRLDRYVRDTGSNRVELCEYPSERVLASFPGPPNATFDQAVFSPDDHFLAVRFSNADGAVRVWNLATQRLLLETTSQKIGEQRIYISPDSQTLGTMTTNGIALQPIVTASQPRLLQPGGRSVKAAAFSPDSKQIVVLPASSDDPTQLIDADSGKTLCSLELSFNPYQVAWHPDGTRLAFAGMRGKLEIRNIRRSGAGIEFSSHPFPLDGHQSEIRQLMFAPDGSVLLTYAWDHTSIAWDLISGRPLLRDQRLNLSDIDSTGDRVIGSRNRLKSESVAILVRRTGYRTVAWAGGPRVAYAVSTSPDGRLSVVSYDPAAGHSHGDCLLWDFSRGVKIARLNGLCAQFSSNSQTLFTFETAENCVRAYDVSAEALAREPAVLGNGRVIYRARRGERINTGLMGADGRTLVIAATDAVVFVDTLGQEPPRSWPKPAHGVAVSKDGQWVATSKHNEPTVLRGAKNGKGTLYSEKYGRMNFSPNGHWVAVINPHAVQIYELGASPRLAYEELSLEGWDASAPPLAYSPDSRMFAVPFNRTQVRLYEASTGRELATLSPPNPAQITGGKALEFSADGQWLLAAKNDGETIAWNIPVIRHELAKLGLNWKHGE